MSLGSVRFQRALARVPQPTPPVWLMRQAGRYHRHYQRLRREHSFMELCKTPRLAAEVALGPVADFDFDAAILFSDLLFPLEALGMRLRYEASGPVLDTHLDWETLERLATPESALERLAFQKEVLTETRKALPRDKSLVGFVGGPWTLFVYAVEGSHKGELVEAKRSRALFRAFRGRLVPLLNDVIRLQLEAGVEVVMIFDTAAGELSPMFFHDTVLETIIEMASAHPGRLAYYARGMQPAHFRHPFVDSGALSGIGVDSRWSLPDALGLFGRSGFVQGNFDQALLLLPEAELEAELVRHLAPVRHLSPEARAGWVCGLGHGVLPETPEANVRAFVHTVREVFA